MTLNELGVFQTVAQYLENTILPGKPTSQTFLFTGPDSSGKEFTALQYMKLLNCKDEENGFCDRCIICKKINFFLSPDLFLMSSRYDKSFIENLIFFYLKNASHPHAERLLKAELAKLSLYFKQYIKAPQGLKDIFTWFEEPLETFVKGSISLERLKKLYDLLEKVPSKQNVSIEYIRMILKHLYQSSFELKYRFLIIKDIADFSKESSNILLKTIEEPPEDLIIILISQRASAVLPTIRSRSVHLKFKPYSTSDKQKINSRFQGISLFKDSSFDIFKKIETSLKMDDLDEFNSDELIYFIDYLKKDCAFFSPIQKAQIQYLNQLKSGLQFFNLNPSYVRESLKLIFKRKR